MLGNTGGCPERSATDEVPSGLGGRFAVHERLDQGRFGRMYRAFDRRRPDRWGEPHEVALLVLPREVASSPEQLAAFERAFETVRRLEHPRIAAVYDFGYEAGTHFMTMEFVDGEPLRNVIDSLQPELVSRKEALEVVQAVGDALEYAHEAGVVHGDVRAENVVVAGRRNVKILFSAACLARSGPFPVDERDDIYGLAALAYELFSGARPPPYLSTPARSGRRPTVPARIKGLSRKQWRALRAGLKGRDERTRSIGQLLAGLGPVPKRRERPSPPTSRGPSIAGRAATILAAVALVALSVFAVLALGPEGIGSRADALYSRAAAAVDHYVVDPAARRAADLLRPAGHEDPAPSERAPPPARAEASPDAGAETPRGSPGDRSRGAPPAAARPSPASAPGAATDEPGAEKPAQSGGPNAEPEPSSKERKFPEQDRRAEDSGARAPAEAAAPASVHAAPSSPDTVYFAQTSIVAHEGDTVVPIEIRRGNATAPARIVWWTRSGTAKAGDDFGDVGRVVETFAAGQSDLTVFVPITDDSVPEPRERFYVDASLLSPSGRQQGPLLTAAVTIVDDDF